MVYYMPDDRRLMFRVVVSAQALPTAVDGLIRAMLQESRAEVEIIAGSSYQSASRDT